MYQILIRLIVIAAVQELGISAKYTIDCHSEQCLRHLRSGSMRILKIDWKPISIFPEELKRFKNSKRHALSQARFNSRNFADLRAGDWVAEDADHVNAIKHFCE